MKMRFLSLISVTFAMALTGCASTGGLPAFGANLGAQPNPMGGDSLRVPYTDVVKYFGYVAPGGKPDAVVDGKNFYYLYVWIPVVAPEIGIRMVSPAPDGVVPAKGDFVSAQWADGAKNKTDYFDTWIDWERSLDVVMPEDITTKGPGTKWLVFGNNDDSSELPAQPSGSKYNSLLRVESSAADPLKSLVRGLYRIGFTTYKVGDVKGTFYAEVGAPIKIPGVQIAASLEDLKKAIDADAAKK